MFNKKNKLNQVGIDFIQDTVYIHCIFLKLSSNISVSDKLEINGNSFASGVPKRVRSILIGPKSLKLEM